MKAKSGSSRLQRICEAVARIGLILSLWQAPIPWVHNHGTNLVEASTPDFAYDFREHLNSFHHTDRLDSGEEFGWHCHWILPSWLHFLDEPCGKPHPVNEAMAFDTVIPTHFASNLVEYPAFDAFFVQRRPLEFSCRERILLVVGINSEPFFRRHKASVLRC